MRAAWAAVGLLALPLVAPADEEHSELADAAMNRDIASVRALLARGADANAPGAYGTPALHWVVRVEDRATAGLLLDAGADPNFQTAQGVAPLHLAIANRDVATVDLLLAAGADAQLVDHAGETPLMLAARAGEPQSLRGSSRAAPTSTSATPSTARRRSCSPRAKATQTSCGCCSSRAPTSTRRRAPAPSRSFAARARTRARKASASSAAAGPSAACARRCRAPRPPLLYATRRGDLAVTRLLVEAGADLERADADGVTPLLSAILNASIAGGARRAPAELEHFAVARYLVERGANVNAEDWYGETPLWAAVDVRNLDVNGPRPRQRHRPRRARSN